MDWTCDQGRVPGAEGVGVACPGFCRRASSGSSEPGLQGAVGVSTGYRRLCTEGPLFDANADRATGQRVASR